MLENSTGRRGASRGVDLRRHAACAARQRRPFLNGKRLLSNQTFRDIYRTDTLDVDQRLKITSLTFLFTDLKGSTELYERVGDLVAFDLVRAHFRVLHDIVAAEAGAVSRLSAMRSWPPFRRRTARSPPRCACGRRCSVSMTSASARSAAQDRHPRRPLPGGDAERSEDYFGQTVNIASRVQALAVTRSIFATDVGSMTGRPRACWRPPG